MSMDQAAGRIRAALDARILNQSATEDPYPLRRRLAYQRILRRLGEHDSGGWVLKGGYLLEARIDSTVRATKDLDLAMRTADGKAEVAALLREGLATDPDGDHFEFRISEPTPLTTDLRGNSAWRVTVDAILGGRTFAKLRIDLVERLDEIEDATEIVVIPMPVAGTAFADARVTAVDIAQHAAEKFHALTQSYSGGRQNTRVKDLLDIVLMSEAGLLPHPNLANRIRAVFAMRDQTEPPAHLPEPPAAWRIDYRTLAAATSARVTELEKAFALVSAIYEANSTQPA